MPDVPVSQFDFIGLLISADPTVASEIEGNHTLLVGLDAVSVHLDVQSGRSDRIIGDVVLRKTVAQPGLHLACNIKIHLASGIVYSKTFQDVETDTS